eukprot:9443818-Pyramimonas_sp.AAC.1
MFSPGRASWEPACFSNSEQLTTAPLHCLQSQAMPPVSVMMPVSRMSPPFERYSTMRPANVPAEPCEFARSARTCSGSDEQ